MNVPQSQTPEATGLSDRPGLPVGSEDPTAPQRPTEMGGGPVGPDAHPGDYGATEAEQRRVQGRPEAEEERPDRER